MDILASSQLKLEGILETFDAAHDITSFKVVYHELQRRQRGLKINGKVVTDKLYKSSFLCGRIRDELGRIIGPGYNGGFSHISILFDTEVPLDMYMKEIERMLTKDFNTTTQTIVDMVRNNNY